MLLCLGENVLVAGLVIGGSGFIGSEVVRNLETHGVETISYDLVHTNLAAPKNTWIKADILEPQSIQRVFFEYEIDFVAHLVGLPAIDYCQRNPHFSFLLNVVSVQNALEAMRIADINRIVFASSATVYGSDCKKALTETDIPRPDNIYGYHKFLAEQAINAYSESYGTSGIILRLFNVFGGSPDLGKEVISTFIKRARKGEPLNVKGPNKFRDFVSINDVAEAFHRSIIRPELNNATFNIGSGTKLTLREIATIVHSYYPKISITESAAHDDGTGLYADVTLARRVLGFAPSDAVQGISAHISKYAPKQKEQVLR